MTVRIFTTPLSFRVGVTENGALIDAPSLAIHPYMDRFTHYQWNQLFRTREVVARYRHYNKQTRLLHIPRFDLDAFTSYLGSFDQKYTIEDYPLVYGDKVDIPLKPTFVYRDKRQEDSVNYITDTSTGNVKGLSLQTGAGKTATTIFVIAKMGVRSAIGLEGDDLIAQWYESFEKFTYLKPEDFYLIQGAESLAYLILNFKKTLFPKVIFYSIKTMRAFVVRNGPYITFPYAEELCELLGIGLRITDEAHTNFLANLYIDLAFNNFHTVALTATFNVTNERIKAIFDGHYPIEIQYGHQFYKKYITMYLYTYSLGEEVGTWAYMGAKGYNHVKYEKWLLKKKHRVNLFARSKLRPLMDIHYENVKRPGDKCLILCTQVSMCEYIYALAKQWYPNRKVTTFFGGDEIKLFKENDIIIATVKSCGTAKDIPQLLTVICTTAMGSGPLPEQVIGRCRELPDGRSPHALFLGNSSIPRHIEYLESKERDLGPKTLKLIKASI